MKIRLIQPPLVQPLYRQLTLPVLGGEFEAAGLEVEAVDENVQPPDLSPVDLVGITCHVYNAPRAFQLADAFREQGVPVLLGGTFPTVAPQLAAPHATSVVVGELEGQTARIVRDAISGSLQPMYRAAAPPSLGSTVEPDWSLIDSSRYLAFNFPLELSRGCRFSCRFCTARQLYGEPRTRSLSDIERDLARYDHGQVELIDVNFLGDPGFFQAVLPLLERAPVPGWFGQTTIKDLLLDPSLPDRFARARCRSLFVGLESIIPEGQRAVNKGWSSTDEFLEVVRRFQSVGVLIQAGLIVGLDTDTPQVLQRTVDLLEKARVHTGTVTFLHYYPGTPPWEELRQAGRLLSTDLRDYDGNRPVIRPLGMPPAQLKSATRGMLERLYSLRSIARRGRHRGMRRVPSQLLHHTAINAALRSYYAEMVQDWEHGPPAAQRYMVRPPALGVPARWSADTGSKVLDRLWRPSRR